MSALKLISGRVVMQNSDGMVMVVTFDHGHMTYTITLHGTEIGKGEAEVRSMEHAIGHAIMQIPD